MSNAEDTSAVPYAALSSLDSQRRVWKALVAGSCGTMLLLLAFAGLHLMMDSASVTGEPTSIVRHFGPLNLIGFVLWLYLSPVALVTGLAAALWYHVEPSTTTKGRGTLTFSMLGISVCLMYMSYTWLEARQMLSCGFVWCYDATSSTVDPKGFRTVVGNQVFFVNLLVAIASLVLLYRQLNGRRVVRTGNERFMRAAGALKQRRRACLAGLLVVIPLMCLLTGLLPNVFSRFSRAEHHRLAWIMQLTGGINKSEVPGAWIETVNWRLSEDVVVKFWPDTVIFYACLELAVLVAGVGAEFPAVRTAAAKIAVNGRSLFVLFLVLFITLFVEYWMHDHAFHGGKFNDYVLEKPARTAGLVASAFMGLLLLPASKHSPVLTAIGLSWESTLWMHIALAVLFLFSACLHVVLFFFRMVQLGYPTDILPLNWLVFYPCNPVGGTTPTNNFTIPTMAAVFWPSLVCLGVFPWLRRNRWELFRYTHNIFLVLVPTAMWHGSNAWYFVLPSVIIWSVDRMWRFLQTAEEVQIMNIVAHKVSCWTDPKPDTPSVNVPEKITQVTFNWPGQERVHSPGMYVLVNFPEVSTGEWHPFSLSSSPLDENATLHIKNMGPNTFTGKLFESVGCKKLSMSVEGPYGPRVDLHHSASVLLVAGGIGITPMLSTLRCAVQSANAGHTMALRRLHLLWSARSAEVFDLFQEEFRLVLEAAKLPFEVKLSLYCSTSKENASCMLGPVISGMPSFPSILQEEISAGHCLVRACGPPPMVNACEAASTAHKGIDFEPWSFVL